MESFFDWSSGSLAEGLHCYRTQQFFEAHEHWESVWLNLHEPQKSFLQSLIQISAAFHHFRRGNRRGAVSLLTRALRRLDATPSRFCSLDVEPLRAQVRHWLSAIKGNREEDLPEAFPEFQTIEPTNRNSCP